MTTKSQWNWRWVAGLVLAGILIYSAQQTLAMNSRVSVLENEKANIWRKLDEMDRKLDRIERKIDRKP